MNSPTLKCFALATSLCLALPMQGEVVATGDDILITVADVEPPKLQVAVQGFRYRLIDVHSLAKGLKLKLLYSSEKGVALSAPEKDNKPRCYELLEDGTRVKLSAWEPPFNIRPLSEEQAHLATSELSISRPTHGGSIVLDDELRLLCSFGTVSSPIIRLEEDEGSFQHDRQVVKYRKTFFRGDNVIAISSPKQILGIYFFDDKGNRISPNMRMLKLQYEWIYTFGFLEYPSAFQVETLLDPVESSSPLRMKLELKVEDSTSMNEHGIFSQVAQIEGQFKPESMDLAYAHVTLRIDAPMGVELRLDGDQELCVRDVESGEEFSMAVSAENVSYDVNNKQMLLRCELPAKLVNKELLIEGDLKLLAKGLLDKGNIMPISATEPSEIINKGISYTITPIGKQEGEIWSQIRLRLHAQPDSILSRDVSFLFCDAEGHAIPATAGGQDGFFRFRGDLPQQIQVITREANAPTTIPIALKLKLGGQQ